jgi:hypothetical protein
MLTQNDLLSINSISNISDVSLILYKKFFDNILCKRLFIYSLEDGSEVKLAFQETHLLHILGIQHILGRNYKASKFNDGINSGTMTFEELEKRNNIIFNDFTDRFLNFSNLYHVITNCSMIYFDKKTYEKNKSSKETTLMDFSYILYKDLENKKIHAGLDTFNKGRSFYCKSLMITSAQNDKIINEQKPILINNIRVIDKKTNNVLYNKNISDINTILIEVGQAQLK